MLLVFTGNLSPSKDFRPFRVLTMHCNGGIALLLQSARLVSAVAEPHVTPRGPRDMRALAFATKIPQTTNV